MPLSINNVVSVSQDGSFSLNSECPQKTAHDQAGRIIQWLSPSGKLKGGTLRLVQKDDGTYELQRRLWYHFSFWETKETALARKLIETITHQIDVETNVTAEQTQPSNEENGLKIATFRNDLTRPSNKIGTGEAIETLQKKWIAAALKRDPSAETTSGASENSSILLDSLSWIKKRDYREKGTKETFHLKRRLMTLLPKCLNFEMTSEYYSTHYDRRFGEKSTLSFGENSEFSLQFENNTNLLPIQKEDDLPMFQRGVLAALFAEQNGSELTQLAKPIAVVIALQRETNGVLELHYVSARSTTSFLEEIAAKHPNATAGISAQIMKSPPGDTLSDVTMLNRDILGLGITPNFKKVMNGLFTYLEQAIEGNYLHGNITPKTIIYDNVNEMHPLHLINMDVASCGGQQELSLKRSDEKSSIYKSPRTITTDSSNDSTYGTEADAYSIAMVLLELLDKTSFRQVPATDSFQQEKGFATCNAQNTLSTYLKYASTCPTIEMNAGLPEYLRQRNVISELEQNLTVKNLISLCFQISEGGEVGRAAFTNWKAAFHEWQSKFCNKPTEPAPVRANS